MIVRITKPCFLYEACELYLRYNFNMFKIIKKEEDERFKTSFYSETYKTIDGHEVILSGACSKCIQEAQCITMPTE